MVVELFDHSVTLGFGRWDEPQIDSVVEAKPNKWSHTSWMGWTSEKSQLVVYLKIFGNAHTLPNGINSGQNTLRRTGRYRLNPTRIYRNINGNQALEAGWTSKITVSYYIKLMGLIYLSRSMVGTVKRSPGMSLAPRWIIIGMPCT